MAIADNRELAPLRMDPTPGRDTLALRGALTHAGAATDVNQSPTANGGDH